MRVVLGITIYNSRKFLGKLLHYIHKLNPAPDFIYFVENNSNDGSLEYIYRNCKIPFKVIRYWLRKDAVDYLVKNGGTVYDTIAIARQFILECFRKDGCDIGIFIDDDIYILDSDMITKIKDYPEDIIGMTYERYYPEGLYVASKYSTIFPNTYQLKRKYEVQKPYDFPAMTSGGALALRKRLIQDKRINFYPIIEYGIPNSSSEDYAFCLKARKFGYKLILDNTVNLHHEAIETIKTIKPWTKIKGRYARFEY